MLDKRAQGLKKIIIGRLAVPFVMANVKPSSITIAAFAIGMFAVTLIAFELYWLGLFFGVISRVLDGVDGTVARIQNQESDVGAYLDIVLDFISYSAAPLGFGIANMQENALPAMVLMLAFMGTGSSFLAYAIMAEKVGKEHSGATDKKSFRYSAGLMEASETYIALALFCIFPSHFWWMAFVFAFLCAVTTVGRIYATIEFLQQKEDRIPQRKSPPKDNSDKEVF